MNTCARGWFATEDLGIDVVSSQPVMAIPCGVRLHVQNVHAANTDHKGWLATILEEHEKVGALQVLARHNVQQEQFAPCMSPSAVSRNAFNHEIPWAKTCVKWPRHE